MELEISGEGPGSEPNGQSRSGVQPAGQTKGQSRSGGTTRLFQRVVQVWAQATQEKPLWNPGTEMPRLAKMLRRRAEKLREQAKASVWRLAGGQQQG